MNVKSSKNVLISVSVKKQESKNRMPMSEFSPEAQKIAIPKNAK